MRGRSVELSLIDFNQLKERFDKGRNAVEAAKLRAAITAKLAARVEMNWTQMNFLEEF